MQAPSTISAEIIGYLWAIHGVIPMVSRLPVYGGSGIDHRCPTTTTWQNAPQGPYCAGWRFTFVRVAGQTHAS